MNLYDLLRRNDNAVKISGSVKAVTPRTLYGRRRALQFEPKARLRIRAAHEFTALAGFPTNLNWRLLGHWPAGGLRVRLRTKEADMRLGAARTTLLNPAADIRLDWPAVEASGQFDLVIEHFGRFPALLDVGHMLNPRQKLLPLIRGVGVEVGPGVNPQVLPGGDIDVSYVEERSPEEWRQMYGRGKPEAPIPREVLARTRQDSAVRLDHWPKESLDFIFSNHVFEHFMNPLQVLRNWAARLRPGGVIVGVVPDARYSFDCRQPLSTMAEIRAEAKSVSFDPPDEKYERWVRHTARRHDPAKLKRRRYSIHMHYYTPEVFRLLADELRIEGLISSVFLNTTPNNKDFGFVLAKAPSS